MTWPSFDPTHFLIDLVTEKSFKIVSEFPVKRTPNFPALVLSSQTRPRLSTHPLRWASLAQVAKHWTLVLKVATSNPALKEALYCYLVSLINFMIWFPFDAMNGGLILSSGSN